jgi:hypothetical protein
MRRWFETLHRGHALVLLSALLVGACQSPTNDDKIDALGGECQSVAESEFHRAGQPCLLCHDTYEGADPHMSVAGTIFATPNIPMPVADAKVTLTDANGTQISTTTNCIGNFQIETADWRPAFPLHAEIECPIPGSEDRRRLVMGTRISRDGSCAGCHFGPPSNKSPGWVYCAATMPDPPYEVDPNCAGICTETSQ